MGVMRAEPCRSGLAAVCDDLDLYEAVLRQRLHDLSIFISLGDRGTTNDK